MMSAAELTVLKTRCKEVLNLAAEVEADLGVAGKRENAHMVWPCPFHNEKTGSFKVHVTEHFYKCFGCGKSGDVFTWIASRIGKTLEGADFAEVLRNACARASIDFPDDVPKGSVQPRIVAPRPSGAQSAPKAEKVYTLERLKACLEFMASEKKDGKLAEFNDYREHKDVPSLITARLNFVKPDGTMGKTFMQARPVPSGFVFGGMELNPLFNLKRVRAAAVVVIVEGEKCVRALHTLGIVATTSPGGALNALKADWSPLAGKIVIIWPDNDEPGTKYCADVQQALKALSNPPQVSVVDLSWTGLKAGEDVADYIDREPRDEKTGLFVDRVGAIYNVQRTLDEATPTGPLAMLHAGIASSASGLRRSVPFDAAEISRATKAFRRGTVSILCGGPGSRKSYWLVQNLIHWTLNTGEKAAVLMMEDGDLFHCERMVSQLVGFGDYNDPDWQEYNSGAAAHMLNSVRAEMERIAPCIEAPGAEKNYTVEWLLKWIEAKCLSGCRLICVDPITAMEKGRFGHNDDQLFMMGAKRLVEQHGASLFLITHPRKADADGRKRGPPALADLAGGAAYERFAHTILYLAKLREIKKDVVCKGLMGSVVVDLNARITVMKARNSYGEGMSFGFTFDGKTRTMLEHGQITKED